MPNVATASPSSTALPELAALVVKQGVGLGGLPEVKRSLALLLVWAGFPHGELREAQVNQVLLTQLAGPAAWLDIDPVEMRRWLVDVGCLQRDAYGRAYQRVAPSELPQRLRTLAAPLQGLDTAAWVAAQRAAHAAARQARRAAWHAGTSGQGSS